MFAIRDITLFTTIAHIVAGAGLAVRPADLFVLSAASEIRVINLARLISVSIAGLLLIACSRPPAANPGAATQALGLMAVADVALPGDTSRLDYQSLDVSSHRLYIAHLGASQAVVVDTDAQRVTDTIADIPEVHGVLAVPELKRVFATATGSNQVVVIDENSAKVVARTPGGTYPDGLAYDPDDGELFVSDETAGTVTVIDANSSKRLTTIAAGGEVGNTQYDPGSHQVFSAIQSRNQLVAIDPHTATVVERYDLRNCRHPHGLALDSANRLAFIACDENATLLTFDLQARQVTGQQSVGDQPDVLALDTGLHRLYVASESGVLSVFREQGASLTKLGQAFFAFNAHTVAVDPETHRVYLPLPNVNGKPVLRIMAPTTQ